MSEHEQKPNATGKPEELTEDREKELLARLIELEKHGGEEKEITEITDRLLLTDKYDDPNDVREAVQKLKENTEILKE